MKHSPNKLDSPSAPQIISFGCRLNIYESQVIKDLSLKAGLQNVTIINTCSVTAEAERQAVQAVRKAARDNPRHQIIVTGCAAQTNPSKFLDMPEVTRVFGNQEKLKLDAYMAPPEHRLLLSDIMQVKEISPHLVSSFEGRTRAFIEIQNGCDHRCTYCSIPLGRGNSRSSPMGVITDQVQHLVRQGISEVVLTGVDITSYGNDLPGSPTLGQLARRLLSNVPDLKRLRLSSLDPVEIDEDLMNEFQTNHRLMPHIHLSLQSGDDLILKRMKRRHLRQDVIDLCNNLQNLRKDVVFGADVIVGFPTETEAMFQNTYDLIKECNIPFLHIFSYSPRPGTPAAKIPLVPTPLVKNRSKRLHELGHTLRIKFFQSCVNKVYPILIENDYKGRNAQFCKIDPIEKREPGSIHSVLVTSYTKTHLKGEFI